VRAERRQVDLHVGCRLGTIDQHFGAHGVRAFGDFGDRQNAAQRVRHLSHGDHAGSRRQALFHASERYAAVVRDGGDDEACTRLLGEQLPRHDVRVVLEPGYEDLVSGDQPRARVGLGDQVDPLGGAAHEDELLCARRVDTLRELVDAAVDVGAVAGVEPGDRIDHRLGLEGSRRAV
jgi:hypothetical protein